MALPNPGMDAVPFTPLTAEFLDDMIENIESLSDGTGFGTGVINTAALANGAVTSAKIGTGEVKTTNILDSNVTTSKLADSAVTEAKSVMKGSYSTSETDMGFKWVDGKTVYRKTVNFGTLPNATTKSLAHGISNLASVLNYYGWATNGTNFIELPHAAPTANNAIEIYFNATNVNCVVTGSWSPYSTSYITVYYTKT